MTPARLGAPAASAAPVGAGGVAGGVADGPLRVLIGLEGLALGGCPINALDLGRELRSRGHQVEVFAVDEPVRTSLLPYAAQSGFEPAVLPRSASTLVRARQIRALATRQAADVVHVFGPWLAQATTIATAGRVPRAAVVTNWTMENVDYVPRPTALVLGTRGLQREAEAIQGAPVSLMEPPVDLAHDLPDAGAGRRFRRELGIADDEVVAVVVTRVDAHQKEESLRYAVRAVGLLDRPELRLVVVGDGNAYARIAAEADRTNAELGRPAVLLTGSRHDPRSAYDAGDLALGMGGSALRALAHAKPLVVLGEHGFAQVFTPSSRSHFAEHGFFGNDREADPVGHLASLVRELLDPARRTELAAYGRAEVEAFGLSAGADQLAGIYRDALGSLPRAPRRVADAAAVAGRAVGHELLATARGWRRGARPARQP